MKQGEGVAGIGKGYKKRWFSQKGTCLYYFRSKADTQEQGFINLAEALSCNATEGSKNGKWQFQINTPRRIWQLESETEEGMKYWIEGITELLESMKDDEKKERKHDRRSIRIEQMENRIHDLELLNQQYETALRAAAGKLGVSFEELLNGSGLGDGKQEEKSVAKKEEKKEEKKEGEKKDTRFKAKVLYDYIAQQDYEMTIHNSEIITVLSKHGNGWWLGASSDGKQGYFPGSYVEPIAE